MRIAVFADNHLCQYSSILRGRGSKYSVRLENQIQSLRWVEDTANDKHCDLVLCLGDFFDKSTLNAEEISALNDIYGVDAELLPHQFIVGNHELFDSQMLFSSANAMRMMREHWAYQKIVATPLKINLECTEVCYLPYQLDCENKPLSGIFGDCTLKRRIIFSHNDIAGVQYGSAISKTGYNIADIKESCDLFINGHIHNGNIIDGKIINLGNLTGQNFSEDASRYTHRIMIIDTDTLEYEFIDNPHALNFYRVDFSKELPKLKNNAVVTVKVSENEIDKARNWIDSYDVLTSRIVIDNSRRDNVSEIPSAIDTVDHLAKFREFVHSNIGVGRLIDEELGVVGAV